MKPSIIAIAGPTASGKTTLAIELARRLDTEIISFDSRQFYQELNIGVARPNSEQLSQAQHHFIANISIHNPYTAATFAAEARIKIAAILQNKPFVILCGGTGLYLKAILEGLSSLPEITQNIREKVESVWKIKGLEGLRSIIMHHDPTALSSIDNQNPARLKRAAELLLVSQNLTLKEIYSPKLEPISFPHQIYHLNPERTSLYHHIDIRVDEMMKQGLLEEVSDLRQYSSFPVLKTVGYSELFEYLRDHCSLDEAINKIKQHTRNYAKRQVTWFKNKTNSLALHPQDAAETILKNLRDHKSLY